MSDQSISHVVTKDGSSTLYAPRFDEHYHSRHGAMQESQHVFLKMGWDALAEDLQEVRLLEMGFGTGLNAWLTRQVCAPRKLHYVGLEAYPLEEKLWRTLNYGQEGGGAMDEALEQLHRAPWEEAVALDDHFTLEKREVDLLAFDPDQSFHLVYFDAFAPLAQPELWTEEVMQKLYQMMEPGGIWVSYCAKGDVRRALQAAGFTVEKLPGPPGKREMLRAIK
ncbi:MAG: tRNA (5-methylaminomethyl-2-thiouridine)(34)-methyltransferase MnmD [Bacteroidota bacterium]